MSGESLSLLTKAGLVASGGAVGTLLRFAMYELVVPRAPSSVYATFAVNIVGCLVFGALKGAVDTADWGSFELRTFLFFGVLGAFTTFSTFEADIFGLWSTQQRFGALAYMFLSIAAGLVAFVGSYSIASRVFSQV